MHCYTSERGINFIKQCEGFRSTPYFCSGGFITIGYGHKITEPQILFEITEENAEEFLIKDLYQAEKAVLRYINVPLESYQFDALVSFTFNLGAGALQRSSLRQKVDYESHHQAAREFLKWIYSSGKISRGLFLRRKKESMIYANIFY